MWKQYDPVRRQDRLRQQLPKPTSLSTYDSESGQMYTESSVRFVSRHYSDWIGELKTPSLVRKDLPHEGQGSRSLLNLAVNQLTLQFRNLSADHFAGVPWSLAEKILQRVIKTHRESFHTWRIMAHAYPDQMADPGRRYHLHIRQPSLPLPDYFTGVASQPACWLSCLRVSPKELRTADLVAIARISNLAVLDLSDGQVSVDNSVSPLDERLFRAWAEMAVKGQAFRRLEALLLGWQNVDLWLFQYLPCFPALSKLVITDSSRIHQKNRKDWEPTALEHGWEARHAKRSAKCLRPVLDDDDFHRCAISGIMSQYDKSDAQSTGRTNLPALPVLEFWLGTPRKWTHILEDFPGARTIYFDRTKLLDRIPRSITAHLHDNSHHESAKRGRHLDPQSGKHSPPIKRISKNRLRQRKRGPNLAEMLQ